MPDPNNPLFRSRSNRQLAGICGGFADWLGWDATLVRVLYVLVSIFSVAFPGLLTYLILWIVMPEEPVHKTVMEQPGINHTAAEG